MESSQRDIPNERDVRRPEGRDKLDKPNSPATRPKRSRRDKRDSGIDMLNGPLPGKILRFAIPLALSSILQQLLNSADASIAGQFVSSFSLAGIGGVNPVTAMFVNLFVGLSIGANVVVAMHVGAGEFHSIKKSVHTAMTLSLIAGVALGAAGLALAPWVLNAIGMPEDSLADALTYVRLYFCAIPFLTIYNFGSALLRAHGDAKRPLYALAAAVVMNFVLDLAFVRLFSWGTAGIGIATIIAAFFTLAIVALLAIITVVSVIATVTARIQRKCCSIRSRIEQANIFDIQIAVSSANPDGMTFAVRIRGHIKTQCLQRGIGTKPQIYDHIHIIGAAMKTGRLIKIRKIALPSGIPISHMLLLKSVLLSLLWKVLYRFQVLCKVTPSCGYDLCIPVL